jgi:hypothetical protein
MNVFGKKDGDESAPSRATSFTELSSTSLAPIEGLSQVDPQVSSVGQNLGKVQHLHVPQLNKVVANKDEVVQRQAETNLLKALSSSTAEQRDIALKVLRDIELCRTMDQEDRVGEGGQLLQKIELFVRGLSPESKDYLEGILFHKEDKVLSRLRTAGDSLAKLLTEFENDSMWNIWNSSIGPHQDVTVFSLKDDTETNDFALKIDGYAYVSLNDIAAALIETQLFQYWMPMCSNCKVLSSLSPSRKIVKFEMDFVMVKKTAILEV